MPGHHQVARDELGPKTMGFFTPAELSAPDRRLLLRKRLGEEMEALCDILRKAELVVRKNVDEGRPSPRCHKDWSFMAAEARSETMDMEANRIPCDKKRKTMPPVDVEIIEPRISRTPCATTRKAMPPVENIEHPRISKADQTPCAKKRKTMPPVEIIDPLISKDEIFSLVTRLSLLSSNIPARIVEFLNKECTGHADEKAGENEIEIDLGSMRRSAMFELQKLLDDEFSEEEKHQQQESMNVSGSISRSSPRELEDGELIEEDFGAITDTCGGDACPVAAGKSLCSRPQILEDGEITEDHHMPICGNASPIAIEKSAEIAKRPGNNNSSSSSPGSSSSSGGSSGSSCSDSSDSESSDSDDECVTSNLAPAVLPVPKNGPSPIAMPAKGLCSPPRTLEDGEIIEEEEVDICSDANPVATEKFAEITESPSNISSSSSSGSSGSSGCSAGSSCSDSSDSYTSDSGSDDECVTSNLLG